MDYWSECVNKHLNVFLLNNEISFELDNSDSAAANFTFSVINKSDAPKNLANCDSFTIEYPITKEMVESADTYLYGNDLDNYRSMPPRWSFTDFGIFQNFDQFEKAYEEAGDIIIRGVFEPDYGTAIINHTSDEHHKVTHENYRYKRTYTRYKLKIEKIYTENCDYFKFGGIIPFVTDGTVEQQDDGRYRHEGRSSYYEFTKRSLEQRTYVMLISKARYDKFQGYIGGHIFINAHEEVYDGTGDKDKQIAYDILQKYN